MTTATETLLPPPAIPASTLDPLLDDRERACECQIRRPGQARQQCGNPAQWVVTSHCDGCGRAQTGLMCDRCKRVLEQDGSAHNKILGHHTSVVRVEPL